MDNREYNRLKDMLEEHLVDFLPEIDHKSITLHEAMKYSLEAGGKRLRPVLLLAACEFCHSDAKQYLPYACAVEFIQTYSLIHDDLPAMDDDDLRRGKPSNHKVFGEAIAILAGDGLLTSAFEIMGRDMFLYFDDADKLKRRIKAAFEISKGAGCRGMIAGQTADIENEDKSCTKEMVDYIHLNKTASFIMAAIMSGAHLAGAEADRKEALRIFAESFGLAFQIVDDILDVCGKEEELGKKTGADAQKHKSTYPAVFGLEPSIDRAKELLETALEAMAPYYDEAEVFTAAAEALLEKLPNLS